MTPSQLVLEITETVPVVDLAEAAAQIARLNATGIKVALDDFGAGYNSLTYLHALPVQIIKLDRGLTVGPEPDRVETLYRSVIRLCDALGLDVIAEGIESAAPSRSPTSSRERPCLHSGTPTISGSSRSLAIPAAVPSAR